MRRVDGDELSQIQPFFDAAAEVASQATCKRAHCGSVIVSSIGEIIGRGFNAPPLGDESQRTCDSTWDYGKKPKFDLTCCVHAEWNADIDALRNNPSKLAGSVLYFMRVDDNGDYTDAGEPYCKTCSRFTMKAGVDEFALWNNGGADIYRLSEYNAMSYGYYSLD